MVLIGGGTFSGLTVSFLLPKVSAVMNILAANGRGIRIKRDFKRHGEPREIEPTCGT